MSTCADCAKMNLNDENSWGEFWCGERCTYYPGSDSICSDFVARSSGGCYITTIVVECLGYDDYCQYLMKLRAFRDLVMKKDAKYAELLKEYDEIGPKIADRIRQDSDKTGVATNLFETYIKPVCDLLDDNRYDEAVRLYQKMVAELSDI